MKILGLNITRQKTENRNLRAEHSSPLLVRRTPGSGQRFFDAADTNRHNSNHWLYAGNSDIDSVLFPALSTLRNRCRYELVNNCYALGIAETLSDDLIGTGPRPQIDSGDPAFDSELEDKFGEWSEVCDIRGQQSLHEMLWQACGLEQCQSGEAFIIKQSIQSKQKSWPSFNGKSVSLRLQLVESDRITTPGDLLGQGTFDDKIRDGIEVDENGAPLYYYILRKHPGSRYAFANLGDYDKVPANFVIHIFRPKRPGQTRGIPLFTPALGIFAQLRRFTLATLDAAEQAANIAGITAGGTGDDDEDHIEVGDELEIPRNSLLTMPDQTQMYQLKAEHPAGTYKEFKRELLNEAARCISMPFNIAAANSSEYNYASGRLDHQSYFKSISTARGWIARKILQRIFFSWYREALLIPGYFKGSAKKLIRMSWFWPGFEHVDPVKEAVAQKTRLLNKTTTLAAEYSAQGKDWERELEQIQKEQAKMEELGIKNEPPPAANGNSSPDDTNDDSNNDKNNNNGRISPRLLEKIIDSECIEINEVRKVLGLAPKSWGNNRIRNKRA